MKKIEAIIRPTEVGKVCLSLEKAGYPHARVSQIEGESSEGGIYLMRGKTYDVDLTTKARVEVIANDGEVEKVIGTIAASVDRGDTIFVHTMCDARLC